MQLAVPVALQPVVGAKVLTRSLRTRDQVEANRRRHAAIAELQKEIATKVASAVPPQSPEEHLRRVADDLRAAEAAGIATAEDTAAAFDAARDRVLSTLAARFGLDDDGHPSLPIATEATIRRAHDVAAGRPDSSLSHMLEAHLEEVEVDAVVRPSTLMEKRVHLEEFVDWFGGDRSWRDVRRSAAIQYLQHIKGKRKVKGAEGEKLSPASIEKRLTYARVFFNWILDREDADTRPVNPFEGMHLAKDVRGKQQARRPWRPDEISAFLHGVSSADPLWTLGALAAYSGARLEELASLRVEDIEDGSFLIREGKRQASVRRVPIHSAVAPLVAQLVTTSCDGFVIPGLLESGADSKRGKLLGKRFGRVLRDFVPDTRVVLHSLRNTVITAMISRGVPLERVQLIVGHETLGSSTPYVDRGSIQDVANNEALSLVSYGEALDRYVSETGSTVTVEIVSKRREKPHK